MLNPEHGSVYLWVRLRLRSVWGRKVKVALPQSAGCSHWSSPDRCRSLTIPLPQTCHHSLQPTKGDIMFIIFTDHRKQTGHLDNSQLTELHPMLPGTAEWVCDGTNIFCSHSKNRY